MWLSAMIQIYALFSSTPESERQTPNRDFVAELSGIPIGSDRLDMLMLLRMLGALSSSSWS